MPAASVAMPRPITIAGETSKPKNRFAGLSLLIDTAPVLLAQLPRDDPDSLRGLPGWAGTREWWVSPY